jgi:ribosome-associated protein
MHIQESEVEVTAIRAQGSGGQNVNKVSSAIHLRFDVMASSLPEGVKERLMCLSDHRITQDGVVIIKSQEHRSQDMNRIEAFARLHDLVQSVAKPPKKRKLTKPTYASNLRRLDSKKKASAIKSNRARVQ